MVTAPADDDSDGDFKFEFIQVTSGTWERIVRGLLTIARLRSFWGVLGGYLNAVKNRGHR